MNAARASDAPESPDVERALDASGEPAENPYLIFAGAPAPDRSDPAVLAQSYLTYASTRELRRGAVHLVAGGGVVLWILAVWPEIAPPALRQDALIVWLFLLLAALVLRLIEWRRHVAFRRALDARPRQSQGDAAPGGG